MCLINVRTLMIVAVSATVLAGTIIPANGAELTDPDAPIRVAAEEQPTDDAAAEEQPAADGATAEEQPADGGAAIDDSAASWKQGGKSRWFDLKGGAYAKNELIEIDNVVHRFDENGYMITGWHNQEGGWEYSTFSGAQAFDWNVIDDSWYFLDPETGFVQAGWINVDGSWYYLNAMGGMTMDWVQYNNEWYYLASSGVMATGWTQVGSAWYYMNASGVMLTGWVEVEGSWYYLSASGVVATGTQWIDDERHWFFHNGTWRGIWK